MSMNAKRRHHRARMIAKFIRGEARDKFNRAINYKDWVFVAARKYASSGWGCSCYMCKSARKKYGNGRYARTFAELVAIDELNDFNHNRKQTVGNNEADISKRVIKVISEQFGESEASINRTTSVISDLGADSLDHIELVMALEEEFETEISDEDADNFDTVDSIVQYLVTKD